MKKRFHFLVPILVLCAILLIGCIAEPAAKAAVTGSNRQTDASVTDASKDDLQAALSEADERAVYYETLAAQLREELLTLKTEFYVEKAQYEAQIDLLTKLTGQSAGKNGESEPTVPSGGTLPAEELFSYSTDGTAATVTAYLGKETEVTVPASLGGCPVTAIADRAFEGQTNLTKVTLPEGVTTVGWFAFYGCIALTEIRIPASVSAISYGAFLYCPGEMTVRCAAGSYAEDYARSYGIRTAY